jgi:AcrR family transcriptional regulator
MEAVMSAKVLAFPPLWTTDPPPPRAECSDPRQRILIAAHELYAQPGKVGVREIAAAAGVLVADVEAAFGDEAGVRRAVLDELLAFALTVNPCFGRTKT